MGVRLLSNGREKWIILTEKPDNPSEMVLTDLEGGINLGDRATKAGTYIRATNSNTVDETHFNATTASVIFTEKNYNAQIEPYHFLDPGTGLPDPVDNEVYDLFETMGTTLWIWVRRGPMEPEDAATGDPYQLFEVTTDEPQQPEQSGSMRDVVPLSVRDAWKGTLGAGGGGG